MIIVIDLKLLYKKSKATTIVILFHISWFGFIAAYNYLIKNQISTKIFIIDLLKLFNLLIYR